METIILLTILESLGSFRSFVLVYGMTVSDKYLFIIQYQATSTYIVW